jgi:Tfp pilus assembly major pilin PilA
MQLILDEEMIQDDDESSEGELDLDELELEDGDLEESGEEVIFDEDNAPSESEPEVEVVASKKLDRKRKRKSSLGPATTPVLSKKLKTVQFSNDEPEPEVKRVEVKVVASGKLKRKGGNDDDVSRDGKKVRRDEVGKAVAEAVEAVLPAKREIKGSLKKSAGKTNGVKEVEVVAVKPTKAKKADKASAAAPVNGKKSTTTKASKSTEADKPFDFNAL